MLNTNEKVIKHKVGLLNLAEELGNVSKACQVMGLSRDTFYRYKAAVEESGVETLLDSSRRKPNQNNRIDEQVEQAVVDYALEQSAHGQVRTSNELRKRGTFVSPTGVRGAWLRHNLACFRDRLRALESKVAAEGLVLTEAQVTALEKKRSDDEAAGEIETAHPGYLGSQDTFYVIEVPLVVAQGAARPLVEDVRGKALALAGKELHAELGLQLLQLLADPRLAGVEAFRSGIDVQSAVGDPDQVLELFQGHKDSIQMSASGRDSMPNR